ncbi:MAG: hypothetical protein IKB34_02000, partial [Clostridia bacterium]|nr:hypothetical protein [Clostridia bacterium]
MKKRIFKIFKIVVCLFLFLIITLPICVLGYVYLAVGGMADKEAALQTAENHLRDNYADMDYEITEITYDWRMGSFYASVYSPSNIDGAFVIRLSGRGKLIEDTYDSMVEGRYNITHRLMYEYGDKVDAVFESEDFPYTVSIGYGALEFGGNFVKDRNDGVILESDLINNTRYDVWELG